MDETQFMGTGGGLCLLKGKVDSPFFFTNCDTLLDLDFGDLYEKHHERGNLITMVCALKHYTVPYGVWSSARTAASPPCAKSRS